MDRLDGGGVDIGEIHDLSHGDGHSVMPDKASPVDEGSKSGNKTFVSGALLNRCPDPIRPDLDMTVILLKMRTVASEVMRKAGLVGPGGKIVGSRRSLDERFRITCRQLDELVDDLGEKEQLSLRLDGLIKGLRMQFGALDDYIARVADLGVGEVDKGIEILEEMRNCGRYPVRIFSNITLAKLLLGKASNFEEAGRVYQYVAGDVYIDAADGQEKPAVKLTAKFFAVWMEVCTEPVHFKSLGNAMKTHGLEKFGELFFRWRSACQSFQDFEDFFNFVVESSYHSMMDQRFFMSWLRNVNSLEWVLLIIEGLFRLKLVPDEVLMDRILRIVRRYGKEETSRSFMLGGLDNIYHNQAYSGLVSSMAFGGLHRRIMSFFNER